MKRCFHPFPVLASSQLGPLFKSGLHSGVLPLESTPAYYFKRGCGSLPLSLPSVYKAKSPTRLSWPPRGPFLLFAGVEWKSRLSMWSPLILMEDGRSLKSSFPTQPFLTPPHQEAWGALLQSLAPHLTFARGKGQSYLGFSVILVQSRKVTV